MQYDDFINVLKVAKKRPSIISSRRTRVDRSSSPVRQTGLNRSRKDGWQRTPMTLTTGTRISTATSWTAGTGGLSLEHVSPLNTASSPGRPSPLCSRWLNKPSLLCLVFTSRFRLKMSDPLKCSLENFRPVTISIFSFLYFSFLFKGQICHRDKTFFPAVLWKTQWDCCIPWNTLKAAQCDIDFGYRIQ